MKLIMQFDERVTYMQKIIDAFKWDSCAEILVVLSLNGKMTARELQEELGMKGEKSIYKPIRALLEGGFILREEGTPTHYYLSGEYIKDPNFDREFLKKLLEMDKFNLLSEYFEVTNRISRVFLRIVDRIISGKVSETRNVSIAEKFLEGSIFYENILSVEKPSLIENAIRSFIKNELAQYVPKEEFWARKEPIKNPAAVYFAFMPIPTNS